jgi:hypothetical protein
MKQLIDRIAYSIFGILLLVLIEGIATLGSAFQFNEYSWVGYVIQIMVIFVAVWSANKIYDSDQVKK